MPVWPSLATYLFTNGTAFSRESTVAAEAASGHPDELAIDAPDTEFLFDLFAAVSAGSQHLPPSADPLVVVQCDQ